MSFVGVANHNYPNALCFLWRKKVEGSIGRARIQTLVDVLAGADGRDIAAHKLGNQRCDVFFFSIHCSHSLFGWLGRSEEVGGGSEEGFKILH